MKMNRVQFQSGLSKPQFLERYGTEAQCRAYPGVPVHAAHLS